MIPDYAVAADVPSRRYTSAKGCFATCCEIWSVRKPASKIGNIWVIPTNKGEWHVLTEDGYYLTRLFEGDPMRVAWPEKAVPGAILDSCPPGAGEEAFGTTRPPVWSVRYTNCR